MSMHPMDYDLPADLIAQTPAQPCDHARLLVYDRRTRRIEDRIFYELPDLLPVDSTLVLNNSRVENCRWLFEEKEVFVLEKTDAHTVRAMVRPGRKFRLGAKLALTDWLVAEVTAIDRDGFRTLRLSVPHDDQRLKAFEHIPLPPVHQAK